ncbi:MAG: S-layer homology domain-containing protein [Megasphaera sp.]|nr:S-layer homology domain-containing protein [Megasphaera sp.]MCI1247724.1 S-layer homology domain-containing protein [Megasphaera sp.]
MKKYTKMLAAAALAATMATSAFAANTSTGLTDINNYWGKTAIQYFYDNHYVSGSNGQFRPNENITRESVAAIINNMIGEDSQMTTTKFTDVKGRWSERAIASLVDKQIMKGYSNNTFKPQEQLTREEFAVIAYNYMNYKGLTTLDSSVPFADESKISSWAKKAVDAMSAAGYMKGDAKNTFNPKANITRGEAVNVLYRMTSGVKETTTGQDTLETKAFKDIKDVYGSVKSFAQDGIMYWQGDTLHIGVKTQKNKEKLEDAIASDSTISTGAVNVQTSTYSYNDYKNLASRAEKIYKATEPTNTTIQTDVDYVNEKIVLTVPSISKETQTNLNKEFGKALRIVIQ